MNDKIKATFVGTLGSDPEPKVSHAGTHWTRLNVSVGRHEEGGRQWLSVACYRHMAEEVLQLQKGCRIYVEGSLRLARYMRGDIEKSALNVAADRIVCMGENNLTPENARAYDLDSGENRRPRVNGAPMAQVAGNRKGFCEDEIPFAPPMA